MYKSSALAKGASVVLAVCVSLSSTPSAHAGSFVSPHEAKCAHHIARRALKLSNAILRRTTGCLDEVIIDDFNGPCPGERGQAIIERRLQRMLTVIRNNCGSVCSLSPEIPCLADHLCPPLPTAGAAQKCTAGAKGRIFDMQSIGFPGAFCEAALGHAITDHEDLADCVATLTTQASEALIDAIYGSIDQPGEASEEAAFCLQGLARRTRRIAGVAFGNVIACRNAITAGKTVADPANCLVDNANAVEQLELAAVRLSGTMERRCNNAAVAELDLCGAGVGSTTAVELAQDCLVSAAGEVADAPFAPALRQFTDVTLVEAAYPPAPSCGDNVVNQTANAFLVLGEECDGADDAACPGECLPPGDLFECTCGNAARVRWLADGPNTDFDQGWTGAAHNAQLPDNAGFVLELDECNCDEMAGAECVGATTDSKCTIRGRHRPSCSWDVSASARCDALGDGDSSDEHADCWICDDFSANPGSHCANERDCTPLCYDATGAPTGACANGQSDCVPGEICRGQCDRSQTCTVLPFGAPAPVSSGGGAICIVSELRDDTTGTTDVVTGEHEIFQRQRVKVYQGETAGRPCPVCGGFCVGGNLAGAICRGTCSVSEEPCRFGSDCPAGETCTSASAECPGGTCELENVCLGGPNSGALCRVEANTPLFGTVSNDCPPSIGNNITGNGLVADYLPATSEAVTLPATLPCTAPGFELFDCHCPALGGRRTAPNSCTPACNAETGFGIGCANGNNASGQFTTCSAGPKAGRACDDDDDCPDGECDSNPTHCAGDPDFERAPCTDDDQCGDGECVDACPGGRCVPLCAPSAEDPEEGRCTAGPARYLCSGERHAFRPCTQQEFEGDCQATCEGSGVPCTGDADCSAGDRCSGACAQARFCGAGLDAILGTADDLPGAGICTVGETNCFLDPIQLEGGDVFNEAGGPIETRSVAALCLGATSSTAVNVFIGVGGAGTVRRSGVYVSNGFETLP